MSWKRNDSSRSVGRENSISRLSSVSLSTSSNDGSKLAKKEERLRLKQMKKDEKEQKKLEKKLKKKKILSEMDEGNSAAMDIPTKPGIVARFENLAFPLEVNIKKMTVGCKVTRHYPKAKPAPSSEVLILEQDTWQIVLDSATKKGSITIDVENVREVRYGPMCLDAKGFTEAQLEDSEKKFAFIIMYGSAFKQRQLCLVANSNEDYLVWTEGLARILPEKLPQEYTTTKLINRWLIRIWLELVDSTRSTLMFKEFKGLLRRIDFKAETREAKELFDSRTKDKGGQLDFEGFRKLYHLLCNDEYLHQRFAMFSGDSVAASTMSEILTSSLHGMSELTPEECDQVKKSFSRGDKFHVADMLRYLHGKENTVQSPKVVPVYMNMDQPLAHYFVSSSHNTYLTGDQFRSESSCEAYISVLRDGCRCIEIDCWDSKEEPIVFHGFTLTSKIKFVDVCKTISQHAFWANDYPLILSIENHCKEPNQEVMATVFKHYFGKCLLDAPAPGAAEGAYPTPNELKGRIIIKHKKLREGTTEVELSKDKNSEDISQSLKNGYLKCEDDIDKKWEYHYFVLTQDYLFYSEPQDPDQDNREEEEEDTTRGIRASVKGEFELHDHEAWFHGEIERDTAVPLIKAFAINKSKDQDPDGSFLVRQRGDSYTLSFWFTKKQAVQHAKILRDGQGKYYLTEDVAVDSLFELVEYYKLEDIKTSAYTVRLTFPVPRPVEYEDKPWYKKAMKRAQAEELVGMVSADGAFIVRESVHQAHELEGDGGGDQRFAITFRAEGKIRHCRVLVDGVLFMIGGKEFKTLTALVEHYSRHPLYRKVKLRYPVDQKLIDNLAHNLRAGGGPAPQEQATYVAHDLYAEPSDQASSIACRALHSYQARTDKELSFSEGAVITNVLKDDGGWWVGSLHPHQICKIFPSNYVEEIDITQMKKDGLSDGDFILGDMEQGRFQVSPELKIERQQGTMDHKFLAMISGVGASSTRESLVVSAADESTLNEWISAVKEAAAGVKAARRSTMVAAKKTTKKMKIARSLSDLIYYVRSTPFVSFEESRKQPFYNMSSFGEKKAMVLANPPEQNGQAKDFATYNNRQISRVYPAGHRINSANYDPQPLWNCGCQLVALNYQSPDLPMWLNWGLFRQNGNTGHVLKPRAMLTEEYDPYVTKSFLKYSQPCTLTIEVISARHLSGGKGMVNPFVELHISGVPNDVAKYKTRETDNGLKPSWNDEKVTFQITLPELALLGVVVYSIDQFQDTIPIGQRVFPIGSQENPGLRTGYRSVPLNDIHGQSMGLSSVLLHVSVSYGNVDEQQQALKEKVRKLEAEREALVKKLVMLNKTDPATGPMQARIQVIKREIDVLTNKDK